MAAEERWHRNGMASAGAPGRVPERDEGEQDGKDGVGSSPDDHLRGALSPEDEFEECERAYGEMSKVSNGNRSAVDATDHVALSHPVQHGKPDIQRSRDLDEHDTGTRRRCT